MGRLCPEVGAETVWKNRSHTRSGLVRFFTNRLCPRSGCRVAVLILVFGLKSCAIFSGVESLHGNLSLRARAAPGCSATPWRFRPDPAALPRPGHLRARVLRRLRFPLPAAPPPQFAAASNQIKPNQTKSNLGPAMTGSGRQSACPVLGRTAIKPPP